MNITEAKLKVEESLAAVGLLQTGQPSVMAQRVALRRAAHQLLDTPRVFEDLLALAIIGSEKAAELTCPGHAGDVESRFIRAFMAVRSRYAEDQLARAVATGTKQYVVLGAGLDTFAYRNLYSNSGLRVYEVDHPATQAWKRERLAAGHIVVPPSVTFVPVDFESQLLDRVLAGTAFSPNRPAFFSWLGVTPYLTAAAFDATLRFIAARPAGSGVTFDYAVARSALSPMEQYLFDALVKQVKDVGEDLRLFFEPSRIDQRLQEEGFSTREDLGSPELNARYFSGRADGLRVFGGFAHIVSALV